VISIAQMLKPSRAVAVDHLEELAARLAGGEAVAPEEVTAILDRLHATEEELQRAVDRQARVAGLRHGAADAEKVEKRIAAIEAEWADAEAVVAKARAAYNALLHRYREEHQACRHRLVAIDQARRALVADENLPPFQASRMREVRQACLELGDLRDSLTRELTVRRARLQRAEESLPAAEEAAKLHATNDSLQAEAERARNAVASRRGLVTEAERSLADADRRYDAALAQRDALEREVIQQSVR